MAVENRGERGWFSNFTFQYYPTEEVAKKAEADYLDPKAMAQRWAVSQLQDQIISQNTTDKWTGEGLGSKFQNARAMAEMLYKNGITDINQFGRAQDGSFYNKATGQPINPEYAFAGGNIWSGTFAGKDSTAFGVQFDQQGNPYFYTTQGPGSKDKANLAALAGIGLMFVPGLQSVGAGLGAALAPAAGAAVQAGIGNAIVQGVISEAQGGDFLTGAALSGLGSLAGGLQPGLSEALGGGATGNIASNALIGGGVSELSGGDFVTGALISGIGSGINEAKLAAADEYLNSLPGGHGVYTDDLPDMSDFDVSPVQPVVPPALDDVIFDLAGQQPPAITLPPTIQEILDDIETLAPEQLPSIVDVPETVLPPTIQEIIDEIAVQAPEQLPEIVDNIPEIVITAPRLPVDDLPPAVIDTSFTPDYSLSTGAPVVPGMGAQGIQVPTINEIVDVVNQPVDFSLPIPDAGFGVQIPQLPNLDQLGGGQGISIPVVDLPPYVAPDTSFVPDYSLNVGEPVIPDMGAQGIQVPTINDVIDVVNQPVDYALPIPDSGLGLQMPTAPNLVAMGGGQGITVPVDGGTLTEAGVIPDVFVPDLGDPNSFINQPAPDVSVSIPELPEQKPVDIDTELALLDVAKALTPAVVGSLLADKVINQSDDQPTGFAIVPIPGDWRSPEYNMAFTPSEAIDFGNAGMLAGTQFARQPQAATPSFYNLSDVINTLNYQSVPFVQQQYQMPEQSFSVPDILQQFQTNPNVGMNDIVGNLDGRQVSIADIISGIQSQYG